jgi:hypothetical protein
MIERKDDCRCQYLYLVANSNDTLLRQVQVRGHQQGRPSDNDRTSGVSHKELSSEHTKRLAHPNSRPLIVGRVHSRPRVVVIRNGRAGHSTAIQQPVIRLVAKQTSQRTQGGAVGLDDEASSPSLTLQHGSVQALLHSCDRTTVVVVRSPNLHASSLVCISLGGTASEVHARISFVDGLYTISRRVRRIFAVSRSCSIVEKHKILVHPEVRS